MCFGDTTTVISVGEREAFEVLDKAERHARVLAKLGSKWAVAKLKGESLIFTNTGGRVVALPASSGGRSYSGNVVLDEFGYLDTKAGKVWDSASAVILHGYAIRVLSTPNGVGNEWHNLWTNPKAHKGYTRHEFTIDRAIADGMRVDEAECWKMAKGDPRLYAQLFECKFLDGAEQYIPTAAINQCVSDDPILDEDEGPCYAGLDIGYTNDLTALIVIRQDRHNRCWIQNITTCKRTRWEDQQKMIAESFDAFGWKRLCVDSTGMGTVPTELLQSKFGTHRVEAVQFTSSSKEELATGLYQAFHDSMLRIPRDVDLIQDVCALKRTVTVAGNVRYDADRTERGHADRAWALALAIHACTKKPGGSAGADFDPYGGSDEEN